MKLVPGPGLHILSRFDHSGTMGSMGLFDVVLFVFRANVFGLFWESPCQRTNDQPELVSFFVRCCFSCLEVLLAFRSLGVGFRFCF